MSDDYCPLPDVDEAGRQLSMQREIIVGDLTPMTEEDMRAWFSLRGVHDEKAMADWLNTFRGRTLDEMDEYYSNMHGWIS